MNNIKILLFSIFFISIQGEIYDDGFCGEECYYYYDDEFQTIEIYGKKGIDIYDYWKFDPWKYYKSKIKEISIYEMIDSIGNYTFYNFSNVISVTLGDNVKLISDHAFGFCTSLKSIQFPDRLLYIDSYAFIGCTSLESITIFSDNLLLEYGVFWGCSNLNTIYYYGLIEPLYSLNNNCFSPEINCGTLNNTLNCSPFSCGCPNLMNVSVPYNYKGNDFGGVSIVKRTEEEDENILYRDSCGSDCEFKLNFFTGYMEINGKGNMTNYENPEEYVWYLFYEFVSVLSINEGITSIGDYAFLDFPLLKTIFLPESLLFIGKYAFKACESLDIVTIPKNVIFIGDVAFMNCIYLSEFTLNSETITFGKMVFWGCNSLSYFNYNGKTNPVYSSENTCFETDLNCGTSKSRISCSPFSCRCTYLRRINVANDYPSKTFCDILVYKFNSLDNYYFLTRSCGIDCQWTFKRLSQELLIQGNGDMNEYEMISNVLWMKYRYSIKSIYIEEGIISIFDNAFSYCSQLTFVKLPESLRIIGNDVFEGCYSLSFITISSGVEFIGVRAFFNCISLKSVIIQSPIIEIASESFWGCSKLSTIEYNSIYKPVFDENIQCFESGRCGSEDLMVDCSPFYCNCYSLINISVPYNYLSDNFCGEYINKRNESVSIQTIFTGKCGRNCFWEIDVKKESLIFSGYGEMSNYQKQNQVPWSSHKNHIRYVKIEEGLTSIASYSFTAFKMMETIQISESISTIGKQAFDNCTSIKTLIIPFNIKYIEFYAFANCLSLEMITIYSQTITFDGGVFWNCPSLKTIEYYGMNEPNYQNGNYCYYNSVCGTDDSLLSCSPFDCKCNITKIIVPFEYKTNDFCKIPIIKREYEINETVEGNCGSKCKWQFKKKFGLLLISGNGMMTDYKDCGFVPWKEYKSLIIRLDISERITTIGMNSFNGCNNLKHVKLSDSIVSIKSNAFANCSSLNYLTIPENINTINDYAFASCTSLVSLLLKSNSILFGNGVFWGCNKLNLFEYYGTFEPIYSNYNNCYLKEINQFNSELQINCSPFSFNCQSLMNVTVPFDYPSENFCNISIVKENSKYPLNINKCGDNCYWSFNELTKSLTIKGKGFMKTIKNKYSQPWFEIVQSVKKIVIEYGIVSISQNAFIDFINTNSIEIPDTLSIIGKNAFGNMRSITSIIIPKNVKYIDNLSFGNCTSLKTVIVISPSIEFGYGVFWGCNQIETFYFYGIVEPKFNISNKCYSEEYYCGIRLKINCSPFSCRCDSLLSVSVPFDYKGKAFCGIPIIKRTENEDKLNEGNCGLNCDWNFNQISQKLIIMGKGTMNDYSSIDDVPWKEYKSSIKRVEITYGISSIGMNSFYGCESLQSIEISETVKLIGDYAFQKCTSLKSVNINSIEISFGKAVFWGCNLLSFINYHGTIGSQYVNLDECYSNDLGCGNENEKINCSPFNCACQSLKSVSVPSLYKSIEYCGMEIMKREKNLGICYNDINNDSDESNVNIEIPDLNGNSLLFKIGICYNIDEKYSEIFDGYYGLLKFKLKENEIQICIFGDYNNCVPMNEIVITNNYRLYNETNQIPNHISYGYLTCDENIEMSPIILIQKDNCFEWNDENKSISKFIVESNGITEIFFNDNKCQIQNKNKEKQQYECGSCINNMTIYCQPFIVNNEINNLTTIEKVSISIICIVVTLGIILSIIIIIIGFKFVQFKTTSFVSKDNSQPSYVKLISNEMEMETDYETETNFYDTY